RTRSTRPTRKAGISPVNPFPLRSKLFRCFNKPREEGISPLKAFVATWRSIRRPNSAKNGGMAPENRLWLRTKVVKLFQLLKLEGTEPFSELDPTSNSTEMAEDLPGGYVKDSTVRGFADFPVLGVSNQSTVRRFLQLPKLRGMDPSIVSDLRFFSSVTSIGIPPDSLFLKSCRICSFFSLPNAEGNSPSSWLSFSFKVFKLLQFPSSGGIFPERRFSPRLITVTFFNIPNDDGMLPVKLHPMMTKESSSKVTNFLQLLEPKRILPPRLLLLTNTSLRFLSRLRLSDTPAYCSSQWTQGWDQTSHYETRSDLKALSTHQHLQESDRTCSKESWNKDSGNSPLKNEVQFPKLEGNGPDKLLLLRSRVIKLLSSPISEPSCPETPDVLRLRVSTLREPSQVTPNQLLHGVVSDVFSFHWLRSESKAKPSEFREETESKRKETKREQRRVISTNPRIIICV
ncbi:hypothetical protein HID58_095136, partial [Brassica napus]